jgi:hypothetical protein
VIDIITAEGRDYVRDVSIPAAKDQKPARCPECGDPLTDRVEGDGKPTYCDTCDREVGAWPRRSAPSSARCSRP